MTKIEQAWKILSDDMKKSEGKTREICGVEVTTGIKRDIRLGSPATLRSRFTKEQAQYILLSMDVGESMILQNETERGIFYDVARKISWYSHLDVSIFTQLSEVGNDDHHLQLRMWRST
jgi:hypothetical protein|tara:strand:+ start:18 stop:374 length:357 start_codon:yes stop_codon:yes gene_type:complete